MILERLVQPFPYSLEVRESIQMSHFSSRIRVHGGGGIYSHFDLPFFTLCEQLDELRMITSPYAPYYDVIVAHCSNGSDYFHDGLWGKPHISRCASLAPNCTLMFSSYEMFVAEKKWLEKHLLFLV